MCGEYMPAICFGVIHTVLLMVPTVRYCVSGRLSQLFEGSVFAAAL